MTGKKLLISLVSVCLLLVVAALPFMAACAGGGTTEGEAVVRVGWTGWPMSMNPFLIRNEEDYVFLSPIYEPLCMPMLDGSVDPWIAESWEYDADEDTWFFYLDERAHWSDGEPLTADDVKFTFETAWENDFNLGANTKPFVESIQVIDEHTVGFKMAKPSAAFLSLAGGVLIMPEHIWSTVGDIATYENPNPVGSGPFLFKEAEASKYLDLVRDSDYWRGPANIDEVIIEVLLNEEASVEALIKGEIDCLPGMTGYSLVPTLDKSPDVKVLVEETPHIWYIAPNYRIYPLNLLEVRQAISMAIDREELIATAMAGFADMPLMGYIAPSVTKWADQNLTWEGLDMTEEERIAEANAILDDLGFAMGDDGIRVTDVAQGTESKRAKLEFSLLLYSNPSYIRAAGIIKEELAKIGIAINISVLDPGTLYGGIIYSGERPYDWDLLLHGSFVTPDPDNFAREYGGEVDNPWYNAPAFAWVNEECQALLVQSRSELDEDARWQEIQEAQQLFAADLAVITLGHKYGVSAYRTDKFTGWYPAPIMYGAMIHPLASIQNLLSLTPIE